MSQGVAIVAGSFSEMHHAIVHLHARTPPPPLFRNYWQCHNNQAYVFCCVPHGGPHGGEGDKMVDLGPDTNFMYLVWVRMGACLVHFIASHVPYDISLSFGWVDGLAGAQLALPSLSLWGAAASVVTCGKPHQSRPTKQVRSCGLVAWA